jgi:hypothetical protein
MRVQENCFAAPDRVERHRDQEQIQMIAAAIGKPKPNALSVARANSESRFAWGRVSGNDMALLLGAPASPRMDHEDRLLATLRKAGC